MYIVEGNIGAGKSTFLKLIEQHVPSISIALEPLHNWQQQVYGQSLLANFYQDPKRWAYTLETLAMICRVKEHIAEQNSVFSASKIVERSIYSGHYCFTKNGYDNGFISEIEWQAYLTWFNFLIAGKCKPPHGFIYLKVDPLIAYERIKKRNRHAEKKITLHYLKQLDQRHEDFLIKKQDLLPGLSQVPVLVLDCNNEFESNTDQFKKHLYSVQQFIESPQIHVSTPPTGNSMKTYF